MERRRGQQALGKGRRAHRRERLSAARRDEWRARHDRRRRKGGLLRVQRAGRLSREGIFEQRKDPRAGEVGF